MQDLFVGRQPVYNTELGIFGYEMLFRSDDGNAADLSQISSEGATSTIILNVFLEMGLEKLVGSHFAFINLTEQFLLGEDSLPFSPDQVILEILEDVNITPGLLSAIRRLKSQGFIIALDDYIYNSLHRDLLELVDIIKIDIRLLNREEIIEQVKNLRKYDVKLLAEKIENMDEFDFCVEQGFDYYQGYFLGVPRVIRSESLPNNKIGILGLLALLHDKESEVEDIATAISRDITISYKLLKLINSSFFNFNRKIDSVKDVVVIMGRNKLCSWASVMAMASMDNRPREMIHLAMMRAKMCELLAERKNHKSLDRFFTVGLFSALDVLMERELAQLIRPLPLSDDVVLALLNREGPLGEILSCALACEVANYDHVNRLGLSPRDFFSVNLDAIEWTNTVMEAI